MVKRALSLFLIILALTTLAICGVASAVPEDIAGHWARADIENMLERVDEAGDSDFQPDSPAAPEQFNRWLRSCYPGWLFLETDTDYITREEAACLVAENLGYVRVKEINKTRDFMDCTNWDDMKKIMALGLIRGYSDGLVRPGNVMTKAEAAAVLNRIGAIRVLQKGFLVSACEGTVSTEQGGILNAGEVVYPGTKIITGEGAGLTLYADDSTTIRIASNTTLEIEEYVSHPGSDEKHTSLVVWCGKIIGRVQKMLDSNSTFEIHTPTAIAGIRGTAFAVEVEESGESRISVYTGQVRVAGKNKAASEVVEVKANEETRITALNQAPSTPDKVNLEIKDNWVKDQIKEALKEESAALVKVPQKAIKIKKPKNAKQENNSKKPGKDTDDKNNGNNGNNGNKNDNGNNKKNKEKDK